MRKANYKQPKSSDENSYLQTKAALEFLYAESIRNKSPDLAAILQESIQNCAKLIEGEVVLLSDAADAMHFLRFIKTFVNLDKDTKRQLAQILISDDLN